MKIRKLYLYTNQLEIQFEFFTQTLGCSYQRQEEGVFTVKIGWTQLTFISSGQSYTYHYCFLIPSNKLEEAMDWFGRRVDYIQIGNKRFTQYFESWNAESFYFYDKAGNVAECIVHYDLENVSFSTFEPSQLIGVNEIGMPVLDISTAQQQLENGLGSKPWKGDSLYFGTHGSEEGRILLPNYWEKTIWFPTQLPIRPSPFRAEVEVHSTKHQLHFDPDSKTVVDAISIL